MKNPYRDLAGVFHPIPCCGYGKNQYYPKGPCPLCPYSVGRGTPPTLQRFVTFFTMTTMSNLQLLTYEMLFEFVEEMSPDFEMCVDFLESQDIGITEEVQDVILDLLFPEEV